MKEDKIGGTSATHEKNEIWICLKCIGVIEGKNLEDPDTPLH
jgi:hypothetical protein